MGEYPPPGALLFMWFAWIFINWRTDVKTVRQLFNLSEVTGNIVQIYGMFRLQLIKTTWLKLEACCCWFLHIWYGFVQTFLFFQRSLFFLPRLTYNRTKAQAATLRECHCTTSAMLQITVCWDLTRLWSVNARVCQLFEVCQHEFANFRVKAA